MKKLLLLGICSVAAGYAQAELVSAGVLDGTTLGRLTTDTETNTQWLSLNETLGKSYDLVLAETGVGGKYEGFSFATAAQVSDLFVNAGWDGRTYEDKLWGAVSADIVDASTVYSHLGGYAPRCPADMGCDNQSLAYVMGLVSDVAEPGAHTVYGGYFGRSYFPFSYRGISSSQLDTKSSWVSGAFLYRPLSVSPVPEPSTFGLYGIGLVGLYAQHRRYKRKSAAK